MYLQRFHNESIFDETIRAADVRTDVIALKLRTARRGTRLRQLFGRTAATFLANTKSVIKLLC